MWARLAHLPDRRIGLAWAGGQRPDNPHAAAIDRRRSVPIGALNPLTTVEGCGFVSRCVGHDGRATGADWLFDPTDAITDFADTAALMAGLDLVIAVDTAAAHLAGALGRPVWLLNRFDTCWRWLLDRDDSPWYPTMRQFRQTEPDAWGPVIERVRQALAVR